MWLSPYHQEETLSSSKPPILTASSWHKSQEAKQNLIFKKKIPQQTKKNLWVLSIDIRETKTVSQVLFTT